MEQDGVRWSEIEEDGEIRSQIERDRDRERYSNRKREWATQKTNTHRKQTNSKNNNGIEVEKNKANRLPVDDDDDGETYGWVLVLLLNLSTHPALVWVALLMYFFSFIALILYWSRNRVSNQVFVELHQISLNLLYILSKRTDLLILAVNEWFRPLQKRLSSIFLLLTKNSQNQSSVAWWNGACIPQ